jgi:hypothetical protein
MASVEQKVAPSPADVTPCLQCDWEGGDMMPGVWWAFYCERCGPQDSVK